MGLEIVHPEYRRVDPNAAEAPEEHLTPDISRARRA